MYKSGSHPKKGMWQTWLLSIAIWFATLATTCLKSIYLAPIPGLSENCRCVRNLVICFVADLKQLPMDLIICRAIRSNTDQNLLMMEATPCNQFSPLKLSQCHQDRWKKTDHMFTSSIKPNGVWQSFLIAFLPEILEARELEVMRFVSSLTDIVDNGAVLKVPMKSETVNCWPTQGYFQHYYIHYSSTWEGGYLPVNHRFDNQ